MFTLLFFYLAFTPTHGCINWEELQNTRAQIEQALHNKNNLDAPLNTASKLPALHEALDKPQLYDLVEPLLQAGANPNLYTNGFAATPLHRAAIHNTTIEQLILLLHYHAQVNDTNLHHETALMFAIEFGNYQGAQLLLEHGADPNAQDQFDNTALHKACNYQKKYYTSNHALRQNMIKLLLYHGANPCIENKYNQTALDSAQENGFSYLVLHMHSQEIRFARQLLIILKKAGIAADMNIAQRIAYFVYSSHA